MRGLETTSLAQWTRPASEATQNVASVVYVSMETMSCTPIAGISMKDVTFVIGGAKVGNSSTTLTTIHWNFISGKITSSALNKNAWTRSSSFSSLKWTLKLISYKNILMACRKMQGGMQEESTCQALTIDNHTSKTEARAVKGEGGVVEGILIPSHCHNQPLSLCGEMSWRIKGN